MKQVYLSFITILSVIFISCGGDTPKTKNSAVGKGGVYYGGNMRLNEVEAFKTLNPIGVNEIIGVHIGTQMLEGLVKFNQNDLSIKPAIAYRWETNTNQTEWTFHIQPNVFFHNDACFPDGKGRMVTANDIKLCFDKLCTADAANAQFDVTFKDRVKGANEAFSSSKSGKDIAVSGINVINDSTLKITLTRPFAGFLNVLAMPGCWIYPQEALAKYGQDIRIHPVGTGPFYLEALKEGEFVAMKKNPQYYGVDKHGNKLPYLDKVHYSFIREKKAEILEFKSGNLDMIYRLPVEIFHEIMGDLANAKERKTDFQILSSPAFTSYYFGFNCTLPVFQKKEVRLAFNHAIDRHKIVDFTIQGEGTSADYGMVPYVEAFENSGYDFKAINGYVFDVAKAKEYLKKAGYPDGKGFPKITLQINSGGGDRNIIIAEVIKKMLEENLNIEIDINTVPFAEHIDQIASNKTELFKYSWIADYPDPESFLTLFYGKHIPKNNTEKSFINMFRYNNKRFDSIFEASYSEADIKKRYQLLTQAEQCVLNDAPFMPIFYDENFRLEQPYVANFPENALNHIDLTDVYFIPKEKIVSKK